MLFDAAGLLKVTDFGIAKLVDGAAAHTLACASSDHTVRLWDLG